jgi:lipopolysaccharide exporter
MTEARDSVARGAVFTVGMRWINRAIGLVSTLILARLLVPEDFGIAAMAALGVGLAATLMDVGVNVALIRNPQATAEHYQSAWTLRLAQASLVMMLLMAAAPWAGDWFRDERVAPVMMLMAVNVFLAAFENIGIVTFQKDMQFGRELRYLVVNRLFGLVCTVALALLLRSYWALVLATTLTAVFTVCHSYWAHPMRPRIRFTRFRELINVSQWMLVQNVSGYLDQSLHRILVGRRDEPATVGSYSLAAELAALPSTEVLQPLNRVLFPAFVSVKQDLEQLKKMFLLAQGVQILLALPAAVLLSVLASEVVALLLGPKWTAAAPLLQALSLGYVFSAVQSSAWYVSVTLGQERLCAAVSWLQVGLFVAAAAWIWPLAQAQQIAWIRVGVSFLGLLMQLGLLMRVLANVRAIELLQGFWRPALAISLAAGVGFCVPWPPAPAAVLLLGKLGLHLVLFVPVIWLLWRVSGRPDGAERYLLDFFRARLRPRDASSDATKGEQP